eukprot:6194882-Pleurochrysis_carterae.AAC.3
MHAFDQSHSGRSRLGRHPRGELSVDLWPALFTQAGEPELSAMTHLRELIRSNILQNMESDAISLDVNRAVEILPVCIVRRARSLHPHRQHWRANPSQLTSNVAAARVDCVLSRIPRYAGSKAAAGVSAAAGSTAAGPNSATA